jgi:hypothetical protein
MYCLQGVREAAEEQLREAHRHRAAGSRLWRASDAGMDDGTGVSAGAHMGLRGVERHWPASRGEQCGEGARCSGDEDQHSGEESLDKTAEQLRSRLQLTT